VLCALHDGSVTVARERRDAESLLAGVDAEDWAVFDHEGYPRELASEQASGRLVVGGRAASEPRVEEVSDRMRAYLRAARYRRATDGQPTATESDNRSFIELVEAAAIENVREEGERRKRSRKLAWRLAAGGAVVLGLLLRRWGR
jgi:hypothetical protein